MELPVDPFVETHRPDFPRIAGPGTKRQSVERLDDLLIGGELTVIEPGSIRLGRDGCSEATRDYSGCNEGFRPAHGYSPSTLSLHGRRSTSYGVNGLYFSISDS